MKLFSAKSNKVYKIVDVTGNDDSRRRLLDMGFTPECRIFVVGTAPFGGTILVSLRGFTVALREDAADRIEVEAV